MNHTDQDMDVVLPFESTEPRVRDVERVFEDCFVVHNVLSASECEALIAAADAKGYEPATVNTGDGQAYVPDIRNCGRCILVDPVFAAEIVKRLALPAKMDLEGMPLSFRKLNPHMRFVKYGAGQYFKRHYDDNFHDKTDDTISVMTVQLYLDDGMIGGATVFYLDDGEVVVAPRKGFALVFNQKDEHEGQIVLEGEKHIIRTEAMCGMFHSV